MSMPRKHHYLPQFYLAGFTENDSQDGRLWVVDKQRLEIRPSKPANSAHQRDFYRIEPDDPKDDPMILEKELSKIEGGAATAIQNLVSTHQIPDDGDDLSYLLSFLGLLAMRTPRQRNLFDGFMERLQKRVLRLVVESKDRWESAIKRAQRAGFVEPGEYNYVDFKDFVDRDQFKIKADQNWHLRTMLKIASTVTDLLIQRNWSVLLAGGDADFITSDHPVSLVWIGPHSPRNPPGFGRTGTQVIVPITKRVALLGQFEPVRYRKLELPDDRVARVNAGTGMWSERFLYLPEQDFKWARSDGTVSDLAGLFTMLREHQT